MFYLHLPLFCKIQTFGIYTLSFSNHRCNKVVVINMLSVPVNLLGIICVAQQSGASPARTLL